MRDQVSDESFHMHRLCICMHLLQERPSYMDLLGWIGYKLLGACITAFSRLKDVLEDYIYLKIQRISSLAWDCQC